MFKKKINKIKYSLLKCWDLILSLFIEFVDPNLIPHLYWDKKDSDSKISDKKEEK